MYISPGEAVKIAAKLAIRITVPTICKYAKKYKFGFQLGSPGQGGRWQIDKDKFERFILESKGITKEEATDAAGR